MTDPARAPPAARARCALLAALRRRLGACGNKEPTPPRRDRGRLHRRRRAEVPGADLARSSTRANVEDSELPDRPARRSQLASDEKWFAVFMRVENDERQGAPATARLRSSTRGDRVPADRAAGRRTSFAYRPAVCSPRPPSRRPSSPPAGPDPGLDAAVQAHASVNSRTGRSSSRSRRPRAAARAGHRRASTSRRRAPRRVRRRPSARRARTSRAAGAAASPPAPAATSSTPTATAAAARRRVGRRTRRPCPVGSLAWSSGGALGRLGSGTQFLVVRSSAVPVLPATSRRGSPPPCRCRRATTASIIRATSRATRGSRVARAARAASSRASGCGRRPRMRDRRRDRRHLQRRRLHAALADRRGADGEVVADLAGRRDRALGRARRSSGGSLKPKRSATSTSRSAPSCAPSGAKTELHDWAKEATSVPPQSSPLAFSISTPSSVAWSRRDSLLRLVDRASSAPVSVIDLERRARRLEAGEGDAGEARAPRPCAVDRDDAAEAAAERGDGRLLERQGDRRAHGRGLARARARDDAARRRRASPPGRPARRSSKIRSRPVTPTWASAGRRARAAPPGARPGSGRAARRSAAASRGSGEVRSSPSAEPVLSRASSVARGGSRVRGVGARRRAGPGKTSVARPVDARASVAVTGSATSPATRPECARRMRTRHAVGASPLRVAGRADLARGRGARRVLVGGGEARATRRGRALGVESSVYIAA